MTCALCIKHGQSNALTVPNSNFRTSTLTRHANGNDHKRVVVAQNKKTDFVAAINRVASEKEASVVVAMKVVYWMSKEDISLTKFDSLMSLMRELKCPDVAGLQTGKSVTYCSDKSAVDMLHSIATSVRKGLDNQIIRSPFVSLLADESTDIAVKKKLVVYARVVNPDTFQASTHFVCNLQIESANGKAIASSLCTVADNKSIPKTKIMGLGRDGAAVMTGKKEGVTGHMLRENPMMVNYHCIAHRLALVTSQAANEVSYLKEYQDILTGLFYYFKASANRTTKLESMQKVLDDPILKIKEVHEVRWMSVYIAVQTIYRSLDSLISFFATEKDAKAKGYLKKISQYDFLATTYMLMDVLPCVSELCLVFQKADLDVAMVQVSVDHCKKALAGIKTGEVLHSTHLQQLQNDHLSIEDNKLVFKGNHIVQIRQNIDSIKQKFIDEILKKLDERFMDGSIMYAMGIFGLRPITFMSRADLQTWGNKELDILIDHFGQSKTSPISGHSTEAVIDAEATRQEWDILKPLVVNSGYPRDKMGVLWGLINQYHKVDFPNLITLAAIALTAPIHTAYFERGFSSQNQVKTALRNRLSPERLDDLLTVKLEGPKLESFDFIGALKQWRSEKKRKLFN